MANKVKLNIAGSEFTINTEEEESYIKALAEELNRRIAKLTNSNKYLSPSMVVSIAALQYCDEAKKRRIECEELKAQSSVAMQVGAKLRLEKEEALREIERITRENRALLEKVDKL